MPAMLYQSLLLVRHGTPDERHQLLEAACMFLSQAVDERQGDG